MLGANPGLNQIVKVDYPPSNRESAGGEPNIKAVVVFSFRGGKDANLRAWRNNEIRISGWTE